MQKNVRVGTVVMQSVLQETSKNIENMLHYIQQAHSTDVQIICFPEMNITGYCNRNAIMNLAESIPGPSSDKLMDFANHYKMTILAGIAEKQDNEVFYITHMVASPNEQLGIYRKLYLGPPEKKIFSCGHDAPVFKSHGLCFGIQLCYDAHFPELSTLMNISGAEVIFIPHASPHGTSEQKFKSWMRHLSARAYDNSIFVVACNALGENCSGLTFPGLSLALDPSGNLLSKVLTDQPHLMVTDLKVSDLEYVRNHEMRYFFPNRREDIY